MEKTIKIGMYPGVTALNRSLPRLDALKVQYIVLHCSATYSFANYSEKLLDSDHRVRGFVMAGYHFYIRKSGRIVQFRGIDRVGAHVKGYNSRSVGVCYEGGLTVDGTPGNTMTGEQVASCRALLTTLHNLFPSAKIVGHNDLNPKKACPGFKVVEEDWLEPDV